MISKKIEKAINDQINAEMWSAYLYLSMAAYFTDINLSGFANWMKVQYNEEVSHAMKFFDYLTERGGRVELQPIAEVPTTWESPNKAIEETLKHEQHVTALIHNLMDMAIEEKDHATASLLQWYVDEQVEEEASAEELLNKLEMVQEHRPALFFMDKELASRAFTDET